MAHGPSTSVAERKTQVFLFRLFVRSSVHALPNNRATIRLSKYRLALTQRVAPYLVLPRLVSSRYLRVAIHTTPHASYHTVLRFQFFRSSHAPFVSFFPPKISHHLMDQINRSRYLYSFLHLDILLFIFHAVYRKREYFAILKNKLSPRDDKID